MRGAVTGIPGFQSIEIEKDNKDFQVTFDPDKTSEANLMAAIEAAGEGVNPTN